MSRILLTNHSAQTWNLKRYQPTLFLSGRNETPFNIPTVDGRTIICDTEGRPEVTLHARWRVPSFGEVTLTTEKIMPREQAYNLNVELARGRLTNIKLKRDEWMAKGFVPSQAFVERLREAEFVFAHANGAEGDAVDAIWADLSLSQSLPAGEMMALEYAEWGIERRKKAGGFTDFLLGCNFFQYPKCKDTEYDRRFAELFNAATLPFYWAEFEPVKGHPDWESIDVKLEWLERHGMKSKGHPLHWGHSVPYWIDPRDLEELKGHIKNRIAEIVGRYKGRIGYWDVINEIQHYLKYRITKYTSEEAIELTRLCADSARQADPAARLVVNADDPFGEYMAWRPYSGFAPVDYFEELEQKKIDYDIIGIQLYYGGGFSYCRDMFEISRYFDRYEKFGKEVHLTETGAPSAEGEDPMDMTHPHKPDKPVEKPQDTRTFEVDYNEPWENAGGHWKASESGYWHGPWSQRNQADWAESFYKVLMGKPFITGIVWWDFTDAKPHFWNHGGLLDGNMEPKESYFRLLELKKRVMGL